MSDDVPCPWCEGKTCEKCDHDGTVPRWVYDAVTTDGFVR